MNDTNEIKQFILAGNAIFTLTSKKSDNHLTFKMRKADGPNFSDDAYFISYLSGPNNDADYSYLGMLFINNGKLTIRMTAKSPSDQSRTMAAFTYFLGRLEKGDLGEQLDFQHAGRCGRCGRTLTDPESIRTGLGPICRQQQ